ncbi:MAG: glutamyl-tRNA reductase [Deltaproteobacteria bacterium GWA2_45_12]|nr:MAG: glutamyl-tRNA reductase [Deltaproteobacteria bacterium GWA2_45_12]
MTLLLVGMNHKTAPVAIREKIAKEPRALEFFLNKIKKELSLTEIFGLSTCNRFEIVAVTQDASSPLNALKTFFAAETLQSLPEIEKFIYVHENTEAYRHLLRVASSLDSMVLGENQILGQFRDAYQSALDAETTGPILNRLLQKTLQFAKNVHSETCLGAGSVSVGSVAVELAEKIFDTLQNKKILLMGAGEIAELVLGALKARGVQNISITNRTFENATGLAKKFEANTKCFEDWPRWMEENDVVITSLAISSALIQEEHIKTIMGQRKNRPLFMIDLGLPRNISSQVYSTNNVYVYNIDDLKEVVDKTLSERLAVAEQVEALIEKETSQFWHSVLGTQVTITLLKQKCDQICAQELEKTFGRLKNLKEDEKESIRKGMDAVVSKILHDPILTLKNESLEAQGSLASSWLKKLFRLED